MLCFAWVRLTSFVAKRYTFRALSFGAANFLLVVSSAATNKMPSKKDGMQPMQMQTSAPTGHHGGISSKPIIIILSAVVLGLMALVVGGGVAVYKVIQTHHMNSDTLAQLKSVESMVQQLKVSSCGCSGMASWHLLTLIALPVLDLY